MYLIACQKCKFRPTFLGFWRALQGEWGAGSAENAVNVLQGRNVGATAGEGGNSPGTAPGEGRLGDCARGKAPGERRWGKGAL